MLQPFLSLSYGKSISSGFLLSLHGFDPDTSSELQLIFTIVTVFSRQLLPTAVSHHFLWNLIQVTGLQRLDTSDKVDQMDK